MESTYRPSGKKYLHVNDSAILKIDKNYIENLKLLAKEDDSGRCTMCLHNDIRDYLHEMVHVCPKNTYVRPHSHPIKTETKIIIEGKLMVVTFDAGGG